MKTSDFFYELPQELIAQTPLGDRSSSKLMKVDKTTGKTEHTIFKTITETIFSQNLLICNIFFEKKGNYIVFF